ncbi:hypothetical protein NDU88_009389 [Pleurodeles waltl]|uniref:Uncharacterized protein n=1 Tax=Pleurodeles waltl TaxID=8319 RepID=A0AAV7RYC4_PLEWA|nr:hypothetical protein NDU88_009389 [Pleurodeles waltl]
MMITAKKISLQVSRNVLWFTKITKVRAGFVEEGDDDDLDIGGAPMNGAEEVQMEPARNGSSLTQQPPLHGSEQMAEPREDGQGHPYQRKSNPQLSQKLKDFVC